jgi:hypothetical protein
MSNNTENASCIPSATLSAVNRIVAEAVKNMENPEDEAPIIERARNKFLILFREDSEQYEEAYARLIIATDPQRYARLEQDMEELPQIVDDICAKLLGGKVSEIMPASISKCVTLEELDARFRDFSGLIDRESPPPYKPTFPFFNDFQRNRACRKHKDLLKEELKRLYEERKRELES